MNEELISLCKKGNNSAQQTLYEHYANKMFRVCYRYVKNESDAEDILINGFMKVFQNIKKLDYRGELSLNAWIKKIIVNESLMHLRSKKSWVMLEESAANHREEVFNVDSSLAAEEIYRLILELPLGYRTVFNLYAIEGYNHKEIGELLKISENTSKSQLSKARTTLKELLIKNGIEI